MIHLFGTLRVLIHALKELIYAAIVLPRCVNDLSQRANGIGQRSIDGRRSAICLVRTTARTGQRSTCGGA